MKFRSQFFLLIVFILMAGYSCGGPLSFIGKLMEEGDHRQFVGKYQGNLPAADAAGRVISLSLNPDGTAQFTTQFIGKGEPVIEQGRWYNKGNELTVELFKSDGRPSQFPLVWTLSGKSLIPKSWDHELYGSIGLPLIKERE